MNIINLLIAQFAYGVTRFVYSRHRDKDHKPTVRDLRRAIHPRYVDALRGFTKQFVPVPLDDSGEPQWNAVNGPYKLKPDTYEYYEQMNTDILMDLEYHDGDNLTADFTTYIKNREEGKSSLPDEYEEGAPSSISVQNLVARSYVFSASQLLSKLRSAVPMRGFAPISEMTAQDLEDVINADLVDLSDCADAKGIDHLEIDLLSAMKSDPTIELSPVELDECTVLQAEARVWQSWVEGLGIDPTAEINSRRRSAAEFRENQAKTNPFLDSQNAA